MAKKQYEDPVNRTLRLYVFEIMESFNQLKKEDPTFYRYKDHFYRDEDITLTEARHRVNDLRALEKRVQELTGDKEAKLIRTVTFEDLQDKYGQKSKLKEKK